MPGKTPEKRNRMKNGRMRKRSMALLLTAAVLVLTAAAGAEGVLTVTQQRTIIYKDAPLGVYFARVKNTGDAPIAIGEGKLVLKNDKGKELYAEDYLATHPLNILLQPGEYTYIGTEMIDDKLVGAKAGEAELTLTPAAEGRTYDRLTTSAELVRDDGLFGSYMAVTVTNNLDKTVDGFVIRATLLSDQGELLFFHEETLRNILLPAGNTLIFRMNVYDELMEDFAANNKTIGDIDAVAYIRRLK